MIAFKEMEQQPSEALERLEIALQHASPPSPAPEVASPRHSIEELLAQRSAALEALVRQSVSQCPILEAIPGLLLDWMRGGAIVRILGAGRARLAASIPANRLAHGGARVYVQNDLVPMPNSVCGGGVIAASASGKTESVLRALQLLRKETARVVVLGVADAEATEFRNCCDYFIGLREPTEPMETAVALGDLKELAIAEILDALVVAAGRLGGFDQQTWRLGHENIAETGPYEASPEKPDQERRDQDWVR